MTLQVRPPATYHKEHWTMTKFWTDYDLTRLWPNFELTRLWQRIWPEMTKPWLVDRDYYCCSPCWTTWQSATNHNTELWEDSDQIMGTLWPNLDHLCTSTVDKMIDDGLKVLVLNWWKRLEVSLPLYHTRSTTTSWYTTRANLSSTWAKEKPAEVLALLCKSLRSTKSNKRATSIMKSNVSSSWICQWS